MITITVYGTPEPAGSKVRNRFAGVRDDNPKAKPWKDSVAQRAGEQYDGPLLDGALRVSMTFTRARASGHFGRGRNAGKLRGSAPAHPTKRPDVLKLARAVEDALTGVVWRDDSQIVDEHLVKDWGDRDGVTITVAEVPPPNGRPVIT